MILLDEPASATPALLPALGQLDELAEQYGLNGQTFLAVGYGVDENFVRKGIRRVATSDFRSLVPTDLFTSQNPSTGDGGGCAGDSGGPNFLGDTQVVAALTASGDHACRSLNKSRRLDIPAAQSFIAPFLE